MKFEALIITGTRCAGKTTLSEQFLQRNSQFALVNAITTRPKRDSEEGGHYVFVSDADFKKKDLFVSVTYHEYSYGIEINAIQNVLQRGAIPLMIVSPESVKLISEKNDSNFHLTLFIDSDDEELDERLTNRGKTDKDLKAEKKQRTTDRQFAYKSVYRLKNNGPSFDTMLCDLIFSLWEIRKTGGMLPRRLISLLLKFDCLLKESNIESTSNSSYDLSLGDEYYYKGKIKSLSSKNPFILIEPYDYAIVTSKEIANFPNDIAGRFDLKVSLFCQGVVLSNGTQIDPGFEGKLFCLLFNTSNSPVVLKRGQHYSTIEFIKLLEPTDGYEGVYQSKMSIIHYLPSNTLQGGVSELKKEVEKLKSESIKIQGAILGIISLLLALIAIYRVMA